MVKIQHTTDKAVRLWDEQLDIIIQWTRCFKHCFYCRPAGSITASLLTMSICLSVSPSVKSVYYDCWYSREVSEHYVSQICKITVRDILLTQCLMLYKLHDLYNTLAIVITVCCLYHSSNSLFVYATKRRWITYSTHNAYTCTCTDEKW